MSEDNFGRRDFLKSAVLGGAAAATAGMPATAAAQANAAAWWDGIKHRYARSEITFSGEDAKAGITVPGELFDSVAENL